MMCANEIVAIANKTYAENMKFRCERAMEVVAERKANTFFVAEKLVEKLLDEARRGCLTTYVDEDYVRCFDSEKSLLNSSICYYMHLFEKDVYFDDLKEYLSKYCYELHTRVESRNIGKRNGRNCYAKFNVLRIKATPQC